MMRRTVIFVFWLSFLAMLYYRFGVIGGRPRAGDNPSVKTESVPDTAVVPTPVLFDTMAEEILDSPGFREIPRRLNSSLRGRLPEDELETLLRVLSHLLGPLEHYEGGQPAPGQSLSTLAKEGSMDFIARAAFKKGESRWAFRFKNEGKAFTVQDVTVESPALEGLSSVMARARREDHFSRHFLLEQMSLAGRRKTRAGNKDRHSAAPGETYEQWFRTIRIPAAVELFRIDTGRYPAAEEGLSVLVRNDESRPIEGWQGPYLDEEEMKMVESYGVMLSIADDGQYHLTSSGVS